MNKIESANQLNLFLNGVVKLAGLKLKYRITVDPPLGEDRNWERPEILVEFAGPDSALLLERGPNCSGLWSCWPWKCFTCRQRARKDQLRLHGSPQGSLEELRLSARVAAEKSATGHALRVCADVLAGAPHVHLALRDEQDLRTESSGEGLRRSVVLYPKVTNQLPSRVQTQA